MRRKFGVQFCGVSFRAAQTPRIPYAWTTRLARDTDPSSCCADSGWHHPLSCCLPEHVIPSRAGGEDPVKYDANHRYVIPSREDGEESPGKKRSFVAHAEGIPRALRRSGWHIHSNADGTSQIRCGSFIVRRLTMTLPSLMLPVPEHVISSRADGEKSPQQERRAPADAMGISRRAAADSGW